MKYKLHLIHVESRFQDSFASGTHRIFGTATHPQARTRLAAMVRPLEDTTNHLAPRRTKFAPARKPAPLQDLDAIATKPYVPERKKHAERPTTKMNRSLQLLFVAWLVAPYALARLVDPVGCAAAWRWNLNTLKRLQAYQSSPLFLARL